MSKYATEFVGTYFLVLIIGLVVATGTPMAPLAIGVGLMALVHMGFHTSGAQYNPAVTIALAVNRDMPLSDVFPYIIAQMLGALTASVTVTAMGLPGFLATPAVDVPIGVAFAAEVLFTFLLMITIFHVAVSEQSKGNNYYGLAIGLVVSAGIFSVGGVSGAVFNPAVGLGPAIHQAIVGTASVSHVWLYFAGPILGAVVAVPLFRLQENRWKP